MRGKGFWFLAWLGCLFAGWYLAFRLHAEVPWTLPVTAVATVIGTVAWLVAVKDERR